MYTTAMCSWEVSGVPPKIGQEVLEKVGSLGPQPFCEINSRSTRKTE
jgi:hypothetical protein